MSDEERWSAVDRYISQMLVQPDHALEQALRSCDEAGLPAISVSPAHGKLLHLMARMVAARRILEIGTLGGYSTIWLARALPAGGKLITLEVEARHAEVAQKNLARAELADSVEIVIGRALDTLPQLARDKRGPFDFVFIDADKPSIKEYFEWSLKLSRPGSVIVVDNVIRRGAVVDAASKDESVQGVRRFNEMLSREKRVTATAIQTVGVKGYDGFCVARVLDAP